MSRLFSPITLRGETFRNRVFVSPMCMYSSTDGLPNDFHMVHLGGFALGGAAMVTVEATAVCPEGRISLGDLGIWHDTQADLFRPIVKFIRSQGAVPAIQLAHAGRKASTDLGWRPSRQISKEEGGWTPVAPSPLPYKSSDTTPDALDEANLHRVINDFKNAARRSLNAGFGVIELHMAHGYLLHQFLSPLSNHRTDSYGGSLERRMAFPLMVTKAVRQVWPESKPLLTRISASDWADGGWDIEQSVVFCRKLKELGVDLIDCSSGGTTPSQNIPIGPGYQVAFADRIRQDVAIPTGAVGMITTAQHAESILKEDKADVIFLARTLLRSPHWAHEAAHALKIDIPWPKQYERGKLPL